MPSRANRPEIPKENVFVEKTQGRKAQLPPKENLNAVIVAMKYNGDWVDLTVDIEDEKGRVVERVKRKVENKIMSSRPDDKPGKLLDAELEKLKEQCRRKIRCEKNVLVGHEHKG